MQMMEKQQTTCIQFIPGPFSPSSSGQTREHVAMKSFGGLEAESNTSPSLLIVVSPTITLLILSGFTGDSSTGPIRLLFESGDPGESTSTSDAVGSAVLRLLSSSALFFCEACVSSSTSVGLDHANTSTVVLLVMEPVWLPKVQLMETGSNRRAQIGVSLPNSQFIVLHVNYVGKKSKTISLVLHAKENKRRRDTHSSSFNCNRMTSYNGRTISSPQHPESNSASIFLQYLPSNVEISNVHITAPNFELT
jgi:hypothetical protein